MLSRVAVEQLLYLMDEAFEAHGEHSLLRNLESVSRDDWLSVPRVVTASHVRS